MLEVFEVVEVREVESHAARHPVRDRLKRRQWPVLVTVLFVVCGMAYSLWWGPVVRHHSYWIVPGDIWSTLRSAHFIGWGDLGDVYAAHTAVVTFPGILLALAPVAMICGAFGLTEDIPYYLAHPTAWYVLGPVELLLSCSALFACDALAERLGIGKSRRAIIAVAGAFVLWNVAAFWGHPEDPVAVALAIYGLVMAIDGRWTAAGWLFGAAVAFQPLVLLMLPVMFAIAGKRNALGLAVRCLAPAAVLLVTPLLAEFHVTFQALVDQPNFPTVDHVTPWTSLAPRVGPVRNEAVAGGPGRVLALVLAVGLGFWARRWRTHPEMLAWAAGAALALRCLTESVMDPFYIMPPLIVGLVVVGLESRVRLLALSIVAGAMTMVSNWHFGPWWAWWGVVVGSVVLVTAAGVSSGTAAELTSLELKVSGQCADEQRKTFVGALQG